MSSMQSAPKRFRIERLEERITPGFLFWADNLNVNAMSQWGLLEFSGPQQSTPQNFGRNAAIEGPRLSDAAPVVYAQSGRTRFPAWAERILREIEHELNSKTREVAAPKGVTDDITFFSDFQKSSPPEVSSEDVFPVWAQELLGDLEVRPDVEIVASAAVAGDSIEPCELSDEWSANFQPQCEVSQFPAWAKKLLSAVDRRITCDSRLAAAGRIDARCIQQFSEVIDKRLPPATMPEASAR